MSKSQEILELFEARGNSLYGGEPVTQLEHALQAAQLAVDENAAPPLVVAALLHDIGHLLHDLPDDAPDQGIDDHHENSGYRYLQSAFPASVTEPVRMHVDAKRYLCAIDAQYQAELSPASVQSLELQGGPFSKDEADRFLGQPFADDAVRLRRWDDEAKVPELPTRNLDSYRELIETLCLSEPKP